MTTGTELAPTGILPAPLISWPTILYSPEAHFSKANAACSAEPAACLLPPFSVESLRCVEPLESWETERDFKEQSQRASRCKVQTHYNICVELARIETEWLTAKGTYRSKHTGESAENGSNREEEPILCEKQKRPSERWTSSMP